VFFVRIVSITFRSGSVVADAQIELANVTNVTKTKEDVKRILSSITFQGVNVAVISVEIQSELILNGMICLMSSNTVRLSIFISNLFLPTSCPWMPQYVGNFDKKQKP